MPRPGYPDDHDNNNNNNNNERQQRLSSTRLLQASRAAHTPKKRRKTATEPNNCVTYYRTARHATARSKTKQETRTNKQNQRCEGLCYQWRPLPRDRDWAVRLLAIIIDPSIAGSETIIIITATATATFTQGKMSPSCILFAVCRDMFPYQSRDPSPPRAAAAAATK